MDVDNDYDCETMKIFFFLVEKQGKIRSSLVEKHSKNYFT